MYGFNYHRGAAQINANTLVGNDGSYPQQQQQQRSLNYANEYQNQMYPVDRESATARNEENQINAQQRNYNINSYQSEFNNDGYSNSDAQW